MALNTGKLAGRTAYISGASRGIGKAIAVKLARDGANVVIAAKTATPHAKLEGTIYTAAEEVEAAGGKALACLVDIRDEGSVLSSVEQAVKKFGGIDILVNNASAISLTGTLDTPMKKYDLMNGVNARGTYLCSQACLPYLKGGKNPHILNIAPPLNMKPIWFKNHTAYTMAKYGMSMCVLGMAEEFKEKAIAVNALWPKTAIATAAVEMLGGETMMSASRKPDIMADAAYVMLTRSSNSYTGRFEVDEDVLRSAGITDFDEYANAKGVELMPDYFLDSTEEFFEKNLLKKKQQPSAQPSGGGSPVDGVLAKVEGMLSAEVAKGINAVYRFVLTGEQAEQVVLDLKNGAGLLTRNAPSDMKVDATLTLSDAAFVDMFNGKLDAMKAFMTGKLKIKGDMGKALKLEKLMKMSRSKL